MDFSKFNYYGKCYWCNNEAYILSKPIAGIRVCEQCMSMIGELFLECVSMSKEEDKWDDMTTREIIPKLWELMRYIGIGEYYLIKENSVSA
ncbi:MAG: hypothetical protein ACUBOA_02725 [Candidatus Loosdrechtia sp.]|uniref:hypothetical protein n=1 Tax=Candidatus Loosdrechtia sp. TaxID=3101272 RepID=UPI003A76653B|nr:MAG: hypothetical protein QY305_02110 [Candidatus Jettenia sp. AMX2]